MFTGCIVKLKLFKIKMLSQMAKLHIKKQTVLKRNILNIWVASSYLHLASTVSNHFFIIPTDAKKFNIIGMLEEIEEGTYLYRVPHTCTTGWYAAVTLTTSLTTRTIGS